MWFVPFTFRDLIDIFIVALIMYWLYRSTRSTNAPVILTGIIVMYILWVFARALNMELLSSIFGQVFSVGVIGLIVVYQPEIRRFLQKIGMKQSNFGLFNRVFGSSFITKNNEILPIIEASSALSRARSGAIIVMSQSTDLRLVTLGGIEVDAKLTTPLLLSILSEGSPLHDGAVVVESKRIIAAKCKLPLSQVESQISMDQRHRAALGLCEVSDAVVVIISDKTGEISVARSGQLIRNLSADDLASELYVNIKHKQTSDIDNEVAQ